MSELNDHGPTDASQDPERHGSVPDEDIVPDPAVTDFDPLAYLVRPETVVIGEELTGFAVVDPAVVDPTEDLAADTAGGSAVSQSIEVSTSRVKDEEEGEGEEVTTTPTPIAVDAAQARFDAAVESRRAAEMYIKETLYGDGRVARSSEALSPAEINRMYDETRPTQRSEFASGMAHEASRSLDLALSEQSGDIDSRLVLLETAHRQYLDTLYEREEVDEQVFLTEHTNTDGHKLTATNDHAMQARFALDHWEIYHARIEDRNLTDEERTNIHLKSVATLKTIYTIGQEFIRTADAIPITENPSVEERRARELAGFAKGRITEAAANAVTSRPPLGRETFLTIPTSEIRRKAGGPDSALLLKNRKATDIDWKTSLRHGKRAGHSNVVLGRIALGALNEVGVQLESEPGDIVQQNAVYRLTELLIQETDANTDFLSPTDEAFLDEVQRETCAVIAVKAEDGGIDDIYHQVRFR